MDKLLDQLESLMQQAEENAQRYGNDADHRVNCYERIYSSFCRIANDIGVPMRCTTTPEDTMRAYLRLHGR